MSFTRVSRLAAGQVQQYGKCGTDYVDQSIRKTIFKAPCRATTSTSGASIYSGGANDAASAGPLKKEKLSEHLVLHTRPALHATKHRDNVNGIPSPNFASRPLVLLYSWLLAKNRPLSKFCEYYDQRGYDVLIIKTSPTDLVWPKRSQVVVQDMLEFLNEKNQVERLLLVHGFSIGGFLYGETLSRSNEGSKYDHVQPRITGQIMDSPVDVEGVPAGVSRTLFKKSATGQLLMKGLIHSYIMTTYPFTGRHYNAASQQIHANPVRHAPSLWLYSTADGFVEAKDVKKVIGKWEDLGILCIQKCWDNSPHIMHFHYNNQEYVNLLDGFINLIEMDN